MRLITIPNFVQQESIRVEKLSRNSGFTDSRKNASSKPALVLVSKRVFFISENQ